MWHFLSMSRSFWKFDLFFGVGKGTSSTAGGKTHVNLDRWNLFCSFSSLFFNSSSLHLPLFSWSISYACGKVCCCWQKDKSARSFSFFSVSSIKGMVKRATWEMHMNASVIKLLFFSGREKRLIFTRMLADKLLHKQSQQSMEDLVFFPCRSTESLNLDGRTAFSLYVRIQQS